MNVKAPSAEKAGQCHSHMETLLTLDTRLTRMSALEVSKKKVRRTQDIAAIGLHNSRHISIRNFIYLWLEDNSMMNFSNSSRRLYDCRPPVYLRSALVGWHLGPVTKLRMLEYLRP